MVKVLQLRSLNKIFELRCHRKFKYSTKNRSLLRTILQWNSNKTFLINHLRQRSLIQPKSSNMYTLEKRIYLIHECRFKGYFCLQLYSRSLTFEHVYLSAAFGILLFLWYASISERFLVIYSTTTARKCKAFRTGTGLTSSLQITWIFDMRLLEFLILK